MNTTQTILIATETMPIGELLTHGGWAMYPIYACSVLALGIFVHKALELRGARLGDIRWLDKVLELVRGGDLAAARRECDAPAHPGARVIDAVLVALEQNPDGAESEARRVGSLQLQRMERRLGMLSFVAQVSPLLGLLGTVLGMVDLFMGLQGADQGNLAMSDLASGIWQALLTTAAGLTVAVPALAGHTYLASRVDDLRLQLSDFVQRVMFLASAKKGEAA